jgi:hypothetical protein
MRCVPGEAAWTRADARRRLTAAAEAAAEGAAVPAEYAVSGKVTPR